MIGLSVASSGGLDNGTGWLVVPALGPWMAIAARKNSCANGTVNYDAGSCVGDVFAKMGLIFDGIVQLTGTTLLVVGLAVPKKVLVRQDIAHLTLMPVGSGYGLGARGSF